MEAGKPHDWIQYHSLPDILEPISQVKQKQFLQKSKWIPAYLELARTMKDDFVYGKPKLDLFYIGMKPENVNVEFDGSKKP